MIQGIVVDVDGRPVADARVMVVEAPAPTPGVALLTEPDGRFVLGAAGTGRYRLAVHADGYEAAEADVEVRGGQDATVHLQLRPAAAAS
jgi:hypothetical protein